MINAMLILTVVTTGAWASQYAQGVMPRVVKTRQAGLTSMDLPHRLPAVHGYVASRYCDDIGKIIYLRPEDCEDCRFERFLIADCAGPDGALDWMLRNNIIAEIDYATAVRWNTVGRGIKVELAVETERKMYE
jgi:hypothetical protein